MIAHASKKLVRNKTVAVVSLFFLGNVILTVLALATALAGRQPTVLIPADAGTAVRVGTALLGLALAWFIGRWLYLQMLEGDFRPDESATGAVALAIYLMLLFVGAIFAGPEFWQWLVFLLLIIVLITLLGLRGVIGTMSALLVMLVCFAAGGILYAVLTA